MPLALDWAKALDRTSVEGLLLALNRFGPSATYVDMVRGNGTARTFLVREGTSTSSLQPQQFGI